MKTKSPLVKFHEKINKVCFTDEQAARIDSEAPVDAIIVRTKSGYELAAYITKNGSRFVTLCDGSNETWEKYCKELAEKK